MPKSNIKNSFSSPEKIKHSSTILPNGELSWHWGGKSFRNFRILWFFSLNVSALSRTSPSSECFLAHFCLMCLWKAKFSFEKKREKEFFHISTLCAHTNEKFRVNVFFFLPFTFSFYRCWKFSFFFFFLHHFCLLSHPSIQKASEEKEQK